MKEQILSALADMKSKVVLTPKHQYIDNETGLYLQGVSSVSSIVPKDWLSAWGAKEAVKYLGYSDYEGDTALAEAMLEAIKQCSLKSFIALLKDAKGASSRKSKQALLDGKKGHQWLEDYVKGKVENKHIPTLPQGELRRPLEQFLMWEHNHVKEWIASEAMVAYPDSQATKDNRSIGYGGTLDGIAILTSGELALIDFKFASNISEDYYLQTAGYAACFESYNVKFDQRIIIRLPKTLEKDEWDPNAYKYKKVPNNIEVQIVNTPYEADRDCFFAALIVKGWINAVVKAT